MPVWMIQEIGFEITEIGSIILNAGQICHRSLVLSYLKKSFALTTTVSVNMVFLPLKSDFFCRAVLISCFMVRIKTPFSVCSWKEYFFKSLVLGDLQSYL